jgi:hypothetical protein
VLPLGRLLHHRTVPGTRIRITRTLVLPAAVSPREGDEGVSASDLRRVHERRRAEVAGDARRNRRRDSTLLLLVFTWIVVGVALTFAVYALRA